MGETITRRASFGRTASRNAKFPDTIQRVRSFGVPIQRTAGYFSEVVPPGSATYFEEVQAQLGAANIVAHYKLDETTGTTAADATGNGYTGTYTNGPTLGAASLLTAGGGTAVDFDGVNDYVNLGSGSQWNFIHQTGVFTVGQFVEFLPDGAIRACCGNSNGGSTRPGLLVRFDDRAGVKELRAFHVGSSVVFATAALPSAGVHFVSVTGDGVALRLYVDAVLADSVPLTTDAVDSPVDFAIGSRYAAGEPWLGRIDETFIANVTATPAQIAALYTYGTT